MRLLLFRHGPAGDRKRWAASGRPDRTRPLTAKGQRKTRRAVRGLKQVLPALDLIVTSPLRRARQTARLLAQAYPEAEFVAVSELSPQAAPQETARKVTALDGRRTLALVGHEPHLSTLAAYLLSGDAEVSLELRKAGACLLEVPHSTAAGKAKLSWLLKPSQLRRLGR